MALRVFTGAAPTHTNPLSQLCVCVCIRKADGAHLYLIQCAAGSCMSWVLHQSEAKVQDSPAALHLPLQSDAPFHTSLDSCRDQKKTSAHRMTDRWIYTHDPRGNLRDMKIQTSRHIYSLTGEHLFKRSSSYNIIVYISQHVLNGQTSVSAFR